MALSYKPLWKLLIDHDMKKKDLLEVAGISRSTLDRMTQGDAVSLSIIERICEHFSCRIEDVVQYQPDKKP